jgi:5-methylcytosine-specific restriction protein B
MNENEFIEWLAGRVAAQTVNIYSLALRELIPHHLNEIGEGIYDNLFNCDDIQYLQNLYNRLLNGGDLHDFNINTHNMLPSAAIGKYITFLQERNNQNNDLLPNMNTKNIILYGPPGVGKTHNINRLINLIEEGKSDKEIFKSLEENGLSENIDISDFKDRVKFVTFHQSFGYEDFIEGFRPNEEGNIELIDGVFKQLAEIANDNLLQSQNEQDFDFDNLLYEFVQSVEVNQGMEISDGITIQVKKKSNGDFQSFVTTGNVKGQSLTKNIIKRDFEKYLKGGIRKYQDIKPTYESKSSYHGNAPYYFKLYEKMKSFMEKADHSFTKESETQKNYYLIIDEINRGNISKIFGELITLIEEDKRDKLEVALPYSKEPFKVPSNLYIIGTMNSTDKSIALIDIALRRRFTFLKMEPNGDLIDNEDARRIFADLNEYIADRLGEDYRIGHSYFMGDIDLDFVLEYKIKPLLEEYFYGDNESLQAALEIINVS